MLVNTSLLHKAPVRQPGSQAATPPPSISRGGGGALSRRRHIHTCGSTNPRPGLECLAAEQQARVNPSCVLDLAAAGSEMRSYVPCTSLRQVNLVNRRQTLARSAAVVIFAAPALQQSALAANNPQQLPATDSVLPVSCMLGTCMLKLCMYILVNFVSACCLSYRRRERRLQSLRLMCQT